MYQYQLNNHRGERERKKEIRSAEQLEKKAESEEWKRKEVGRKGNKKRTGLNWKGRVKVKKDVT
jgi:hypothetical protein